MMNLIKPKTLTVPRHQREESLMEHLHYKLIKLNDNIELDIFLKMYNTWKNSTAPSCLTGPGNL